LTAIGVTELVSTNANVSYTPAQTAAILKHDISVSASGSFTVTEHFAGGDYKVYQGGELIKEKSVNPDGSYDVAYFDVTGKRLNKSGGELATAVSTTGAGDAAVSKYEDAAEIQLSSRQGVQPIQSRAPSRHEASLQAETLCLPWPSGALSRHRSPLARWRSRCMSTSLRYFDTAGAGMARAFEDSPPVRAVENSITPNGSDCCWIANWPIARTAASRRVCATRGYATAPPSMTSTIAPIAASTRRLRFRRESLSVAAFRGKPREGLEPGGPANESIDVTEDRSRPHRHAISAAASDHGPRDRGQSKQAIGRKTGSKCLSALIHTAIYASSTASLSGDGSEFAAQAQGLVH
jgi:hypothetical protein